MSKKNVKTLSPTTVASLVKDRATAKAVIAELLERFSTETAREEFNFDAEYTKQSLKTVAKRRAGTLLTRGW